MRNDFYGTKDSNIIESKMSSSPKNNLSLAKNPVVFQCIFKNTSKEWKLTEVSLKKNETEALERNDNAFLEQLKYIKNKITLFNTYKDTRDTELNVDSSNTNSKVKIKDCYVRLMRFSLDDADRISNVSVSSHNKKRPRSYDSNIRNIIDDVPKKKSRSFLDDFKSEWTENSNTQEVSRVCESEDVSRCKVEPIRLTRSNLREHYNVCDSDQKDCNNSTKRLFNGSDNESQQMTNLRSGICITNNGDNPNFHDENSAECSSLSGDSNMEDKWRIVKRNNGNGNRILLMRDSLVKKMMLNGHKKREKHLETKTEDDVKCLGIVENMGAGRALETKEYGECVLGEAFFKDFVTLLENEIIKYNVVNVEDKYSKMIKQCSVTISRSQLVEDLISNREVWKHDKDVILDIPNAVANEIGKNIKLRGGRRCKRKQRRGRIPSISRKYIKCRLVNNVENGKSLSRTENVTNNSNVSANQSSNPFKTDILSNSPINELDTNCNDTNVVEIDTNTILSLMDYNMEVNKNGRTNGKYKLNAFDIRLLNVDKICLDPYNTNEAKELIEKDVDDKENIKLDSISSEDGINSSNLAETKNIEFNMIQEEFEPQSLDDKKHLNYSVSTVTSQDETRHSQIDNENRNINVTPIMSRFANLDFNEILVDNSVPTLKYIPQSFFVYRKRSKKRKKNSNRFRKKSLKPMKDFVKITTTAIVHAIQDSEPNNGCNDDKKLITVSRSNDITNLQNNTRNSDDGNDEIVEQNNNVSLVKKQMTNGDLPNVADVSKISEYVQSDINFVNSGEQNGDNIMNGGAVIDGRVESQELKEVTIYLNTDVIEPSKISKATKRKRYSKVGRPKKRIYKSKYSTKGAIPCVGMCIGTSSDVTQYNHPILEEYVDNFPKQQNTEIYPNNVTKQSQTDTNISQDVREQSSLVKEVTRKRSCRVKEDCRKQSNVLGEDTRKQSNILKEDIRKQSNVLGEDNRKKFSVLEENTEKRSYMLNEYNTKESNMLNEDIRKQSYMLKDTRKQSRMVKEDIRKQSNMLKEDIRKQFNMLNKDTRKQSNMLSEDIRIKSNMMNEDCIESPAPTGKVDVVKQNANSTNISIFKNGRNKKKRKNGKRIKIKSDTKPFEHLKEHINKVRKQGNNSFSNQNLERSLEIKRENMSVVNLSVDIHVTENFTVRKLRHTEIISDASVTKRNKGGTRNKINTLKICTK